MLFFEHSFDFASEFVRWGLSGDINFVHENNCYFDDYITPSLKKVLDRANEELKDNRMPVVNRVHMFVRDSHHSQSIHIDYPLFFDGTVGNNRVAYNIPVKGVSGSTMHWFEGQHDEVPTTYTQNGQLMNYLKLVWKEEPREIESTTIENPSFVVTNIPHRVVAGPERRMMCSLRFDHPTIDINDAWNTLKQKSHVYAPQL